MKEAQKIDIKAIMKQFDEYVQVSLNKKPFDQEPDISNMNELDLYYQNMEKRLKIKTVTQDLKFQNMLGPMKKLKSFVSIKQFLRGLNQKPTKSQNQPHIVSNNTKRKLEYEDLRGGLYMEKVQNHLRRNNLKRKLDGQAQTLLRQLQENQTQKNQYTNWMENVLGKINMKQEFFLRPSQSKEFQQKPHQEIERFNFGDLTNTQNMKNTKKENLKRKTDEELEQKNFKKVSNFLSDRLRKILTDKYVNNSSKGGHKNRNLMGEQNYQQSSRMMAQPSNLAPTYRKTVCRTTATSKRVRQSVKIMTNRAQTGQLRNKKPSQDVWKKKVNTKMNDILSIANVQYKKYMQEKKQGRQAKQVKTAQKVLPLVASLVPISFPVCVDFDSDVLN